ncbi:hypothetical protein UY3_04201 [Chelonia mydas]|uniref:Uncharacterized protein n=1 Tax=Chelonia mydas TaxID=8469 RepID=M7BL18_CHEMY|nr:hypothetical protein UY3_04201 [Chelonia mydas]
MMESQNRKRAPAWTEQSQESSSLDRTGGQNAFNASPLPVAPYWFIAQSREVLNIDPNPVKDFKNIHKLHQLQQDYSDFTKCKDGTVRFLKIATALDLRFKDLKCLPKSERDGVWSMLSEVLKEQHSNAETTEPEQPKKKINLLLVAPDSDDENECAAVRTALDHY